MKKALLAGAQQLGLSLTDNMCDQLEQFLQLLEQWNRVYNLTAIRAIDQMVNRHILDSLAIYPLLSGSHVLDVGSGAGLPGIPLAIYDTKKRFVLIDSNGKKIRFLRQVKHLLQLDNITCEQSRMQAFSTTKCFDTIVCRALANMPDIMQATQHLLATEGKWLFMKGTKPEQELEALNNPYAIHEIIVPGLSEQRHAIIVTKRA